MKKVKLIGSDLNKIGLNSGEFFKVDVEKWAEELSLDIVQVGFSNMSIVKLIDKNKILFDKKKKRQLRQNLKKTVIKQIRFTPNIAANDFLIKSNQAIKFLKKGFKVNAYVQFKEKNIKFKKRGELILLELINSLEKYGKVQSLPTFSKRKMQITINPL